MTKTTQAVKRHQSAAWRFVAIAVAACCVLTAVGCASAANSLQNASFESGMSHWSVAFPKPETRESTGIISDHVASGTKAFFTELASPTLLAGAFQDVVVPQHGTYQVRARLRTEELKLGTNALSGALVRLQFKDESGALVVPSVHLRQTEDTSGQWTTLESAVNVPANVVKVRVELLLYYASGRVWWDDLEFAKEEEAMLSVVYSRIEDSTEFIDRNTASGVTYYYHVAPIGADGPMAEASPALRATVGQVASLAEPPTVFFADWSQGVARLGWQLPDETRARQLLVERRTSDATQWTEVAVLPGWMTSYVDSTAPEPIFPDSVLYRLGVITPDGGRIGSTTAVMGGLVPPSPINVSPGVHPRLFITAEEIAAIQAAAETDPSIRLVLQSNIRLPALSLLHKYPEGKLQLPEKSHSSAEDARHLNLARDAVKAALGYAFTDDLGMARVAREILVSYATHYKNYPLEIAHDGRLHRQTLEESEWLIDMAWAYDLILPSGTLSASDQHLIENDLLWNAVQVIDRYRRAKSGDTWQARHNAGIGAVAFVLEDESWIHEVIFGAKGFVPLTRDMLHDDGLSWMQSISHHYSNNHSWLYLTEAAYRNGLDLYHFSQRGKTLQAMFEAPMYHAFSDGSHPLVGHAHAGERLRCDWPYVIAILRYRDPKYGWLWRNTRHEISGRLPPILYLPQLAMAEGADHFFIGSQRFALSGENVAGSTLFRDSGMVILRGSGAQPQGPEVAVLFKPHGTTVGHQAADNLTLVLAGSGGQWLPGTGDYNYPSNPPEHVSWYKQTVARNGVVVDEVSQYPQGLSTSQFAIDTTHRSAGQLVHFLALPSVSLTQVETDQVYDGVMMQRTVLVSAPYVIDRYAVESATWHKYDWVAHIAAQEESTSVSEQAREGSLGHRAGYQHIVKVRSGRTDATWQSTWQKPNGKLGITMLGGADTEVVRGQGWGSSLTPRPLVMARREGKETEFVAVMELYDETPMIEPVVALQNEGPEVGGVVIQRHYDGALSRDKLVWQVGDAPRSEAKVLSTGERFYGEMAFFRAPGPEPVAAMAVTNGTLVGTDALTVQSDLPADMAAEWIGHQDRAVVTQRSAGQRLLQVHLPSESASGPLRLFALSAGVSDAEQTGMPSVSEVGALEQMLTETGVHVGWLARPNVVYVVSASEPDSTWLERFAVEMNPGR
jgi:hypothetical protein